MFGPWRSTGSEAAALSCSPGIHIDSSLEFRALLKADHRSLHISFNHRRGQKVDLFFRKQVPLDLTLDADEFPVEIACQVPGLTHRDVVVSQFHGPFHPALNRQIFFAGNLTLDEDRLADDG